MEGLIGLAIVIGLAYWAFKAGKHEGSVKGYGAGRRHERAARRRRRRRYFQKHGTLDGRDGPQELDIHSLRE